MPDRQFGPYALVQQIAVGGMAEIHLAKTSGIAGFEKYVALKMIHPNYSQDQQFIQMLIDEAKITVQLQHVNIAQTFDLGRVGETYYITMEYVDGADLYKLLRTNAETDADIPLAVGAYIAKEVASGLDYAHRKRDHTGQPLGIVHRDVSPQNVLLSFAGEVKLVDFGIAKATSRAKQTAVGVIKGKYYYMSPEQAWGENLDHRTDIFSTGILLYETLTGQMLYLEEDLHKLLEMVRKADIPPPTTVRKDIPPELERIVMRALAKRPDDRYQNAADLASDLERFLHAHSPVFTAAKVASWMASVKGGLASATLLDPAQPEPEPDRGETRRFTEEQLIRARSEFTDENSIIFDALAARTGAGTRTGPGGARGRPRMADLDETSTFDRLTDDPAEGPLSLDDRSGRFVRFAASDPPTAPIEAARDREPVVRAGRPGPTGVSPDAGSAVSAKPGRWGGTERGVDDATRPLVDAAQLAEAAASVPRPSGRPRPSSSALAASAAPAVSPGGTVSIDDDEVEEVTSDPDIPHGDIGDDAGDESTDDATMISEPPGFQGEMTEISTTPGDFRADATGEFGNPTMVQQASPADHDEYSEAPTLLNTGRLPPPTWETAAALDARVSRPAVSELRPPRQSRRTPAGGVSPGEPPRGGLASLIGGPPTVAPQVAMSPPVPLSGQPGGPPGIPPGIAAMPPGLAPVGMPHPSGSGGLQPGPFPPPGPPVQLPLVATPRPGPVQQLFARQIQASLELDEIPDKYKIRRRPQLNPISTAVGAVVLAASVAGILVAIQGGDGEQAATPAAPVEVVSSPPGARVFVDGVELAAPTPTSFRGEPGRTYLIRLDLPRHQLWEREHLVPDDGGKATVVARLDPVAAKILVTSRPTGAEVFIGGTPVGRTPLELGGLDPQTTRRIELRLRGHRPVWRNLDWSRETEKTLHFQLEP